MKTLIIAAAALPVLLAAAPATAGQRPTEVHVATADLDFTRAADRARLERRIAAATEQVCGSYATVARDEDDRVTQCRRQVAARVKPQVDQLAPAALAQR